MNFYDAIVSIPRGDTMVRGGDAQVSGLILWYLSNPISGSIPTSGNTSSGKRQGETIEKLAKDYLGVCYQSNWERGSDYRKKPMLSRTMRWIRRRIFRRYN